jgi:hypothetical protein
LTSANVPQALAVPAEVKLAKKKETKTVDQLRAEVASKDREYEAGKEAARLTAEFEQCEVELRQCKRLIDRRKANPLGGYTNRDFFKMFVSANICGCYRVRSPISHCVAIQVVNNMALVVVGFFLSAHIYSVRCHHCNACTSPNS